MTEMKEKNLYPTLPDIRESPSAPSYRRSRPFA